MASVDTKLLLYALSKFYANSQTVKVDDSIQIHNCKYNFIELMKSKVIFRKFNELNSTSIWEKTLRNFLNFVPIKNNKNLKHKLENWH